MKAMQKSRNNGLIVFFCFLIIFQCVLSILPVKGEIIKVVLEEDGLSTFFQASGWGSGNLKVVDSDDSFFKFSGNNALKLEVTTGGSSIQPLVIHSYTSAEDWSNKKGIYLYFYGRGTGETFTFYMWGENWQYFWKFTDDDPDVWLLKTFNFSDASNADFSRVKGISLVFPYSSSLGIWYIDQIGFLETATPPPPPPPPEEYIFSALHTEGSYIKNEYGQTIQLVGICNNDQHIDDVYLIDHLTAYQTPEQRADRYKELGFNWVRVPIGYSVWNENTDPNDDGYGTREFTDDLIEAFTDRELYVTLGLHGWIPSATYATWVEDESSWIEWLVQLANRYKDNPGVAGIYLFNEPSYGYLGWDRWWEMAKNAAYEIHQVNPDLLIFVHADIPNRLGWNEDWLNDPIPEPNIVYVWHYYYSYDYWYYKDNPTRLADFPFYESYLEGNYQVARTQFREYLYTKWLWAAEQGYAISLEEFGFTANIPNQYDGRGVEPGWPQVQRDLFDALNDYGVSWNYYSWWIRVDGGCGASLGDYYTLSPQGEIVVEKIPPS